MNIYFIGDIGLYNEVSYQIANEINDEIKEDDIIILLGDNFYPYGVKDDLDEQFKLFEELNFKNDVYAILGNHDHLGEPLPQINYTNWIMDNFYYQKTFDNIDIFFIDTCLINPNNFCLSDDIISFKIGIDVEFIKNKMMLWLHNKLSKSKKDIKIICGHYPIISFGKYSWNKTIANSLIPIITKYKVDYYVSGHDHNLQIIPVKTKEYTFTQIISGAASCLYSLKNEKVNYGWIKLNKNKIDKKLINKKN